MLKITFDFETRSAVNLKTHGAHIYAADKSTSVLCMAYAINEEPVKLWLPSYGFQPVDFFDAMEMGAELEAHNAQFERLIWAGVCVKRYGWPKLNTERLFCSMAKAYAMGLPGSLEMASKAVGLNVEKDMRGHRIMLQLSQPRSVDSFGQPIFWEEKDSTPKLDIKAKFQQLYAYCINDVVVERELSKRLLPLSPIERKTWLLDQKINDRGMPIDLPTVKKALALIDFEQARLKKEIQAATSNQVSTYNAHTQLKNWIINEGVETKGVGKAAVADLLESPDTPEKIRKVLYLRREAAKSSTAKLKKMLSMASFDGRARGCFQYGGAYATLRWAGRGIQFQNFPRPGLPDADIEKIVWQLSRNETPKQLAEYIDIMWGAPMACVSDCLRAMIKSPTGKLFATTDLESIESRMLAWLAGQEDKLEIFRTHGKIYEYAATQIYNCKLEDVTKADPRRLIGKVSELALGYQGGVGAFQSMAKQYQVKVPDAQANEIKERWRARNTFIVAFWRDVENAAFAAVANPNKQYKVGVKGRELTYLKKGSFLFCRLPSGRAIVYPYPKIQPVMTPWGQLKECVTYMGEQNYDWVRLTAYGGLYTENAVQASSRDVLRDAMFRLEEKGFHIIGHVHDEAITENSLNFGEEFEEGCVDEMEKLMSIQPTWAPDLPLGANGWIGPRYKK